MARLACQIYRLKHAPTRMAQLAWPSLHGWCMAQLVWPSLHLQCMALAWPSLHGPRMPAWSKLAHGWGQGFGLGLEWWSRRRPLSMLGPCCRAAAAGDGCVPLPGLPCHARAHMCRTTLPDQSGSPAVCMPACQRLCAPAVRARSLLPSLLLWCCGAVSRAVGKRSWELLISTCAAYQRLDAHCPVSCTLPSVMRTAQCHAHCPVSYATCPVSCTLPSVMRTCTVSCARCPV